jgi:hypothetical protein
MIKVKFVSKIDTKIGQAIDIYDKNTQRHLNRIANFFKNAIQLSMRQTPRSISTKLKRGAKFHAPSIEGHPPAIDTGRLVNSIMINPATFSFGKDKNTAEVYTRVTYAKRLDDTKADGGLDRPFITKRSKGYKRAKQFADTIKQDIAINKVKV